jgi:hypothetical protein
MYVSLPQTTVYYRVEKIGRRGADVLKGIGAFYCKVNGGRYNLSRQRTVYASADVLASITEQAFYDALEWRVAIGTRMLMNQPSQFVREHRLWAFQLNRDCEVVDLLDTAAQHKFGYPGYVLFNPTNEHYRPTQELMDQVYKHAPPAGVMLQGVQAPSARSPIIAAAPPFQPHQHVFFLLAHQLHGLPGHVTDCWSLEIEFLDCNDHPVTRASAGVNWRQPRFRLKQAPRHPPAKPVPPYPLRPGAPLLNLNTWNTLEIQFA